MTGANLLGRLRRVVAAESARHQRGAELHHAYTTFGIKGAISPEVPHNEGSFRPVHVTAPEGCILNASHPAAVAARHLVGHLPGALFGALAQVMPDRVMADGAASIVVIQTRGTDRRGRPFTFFQRRPAEPARDPPRTVSNNTGFPSGVAGVPAEVIEALSPLVLHERADALRLGRRGTVPRRPRPVDAVQHPLERPVDDRRAVRSRSGSRRAAISAAATARGAISCCRTGRGPIRRSSGRCRRTTRSP